MAWLTIPSPWGYRKYKIIDNNVASTLYNYQMKFTLHLGSGTDTATDVYLGGNANLDFSDVRFTDTDGTSLLSYWFETNSAGVATVWVNVPSIPPMGYSPTHIYIYYGNSSQTISTSNGQNTFIFFDDFETYPLNQTIIGQNGWTNAYGANNNNLLIVNDAVYQGSQSLRGYSSGASGQDAEKSITNIDYDVFYEFAIRTDKSTSATYDWVFYTTNASSTNTTAMGFGRAYEGLGGSIIYYNGTNEVAIQPYSQNVWYKVGIAIKYSTGKLDYWIDGIKKISDTNILNTGATNKIAFNIYSGAGSSDHAWFDTIKIRKYATPEPTWEIASQETYIANLTVSSSPSGAEIFLNGGDTGQTTTYIFPPLYPGSYDVMLRLKGFQDWFSGTFTLNSNQTYVVTGNLSPALITATNMTLDKTSCLNSCTVTATITWNNTGPIASFEPAIVVDRVRTGLGSTILLNTGESYTHPFSIDLGIGSHSICPDPN